MRTERPLFDRFLSINDRPSRKAKIACVIHLARRTNLDVLLQQNAKHCFSCNTRLDSLLMHELLATSPTRITNAAAYGVEIIDERLHRPIWSKSRGARQDCLLRALWNSLHRYRNERANGGKKDKTGVGQRDSRWIQMSKLTTDWPQFNQLSVIG